MAIASYRNVLREASSSLPGLRAVIAAKTDFTVLTCLSHTPPLCGALGGLKMNLHSSKVLWSLGSMSLLNSLSAPTKFVPLSQNMLLTGPLMDVKQRRPLIKQSVVRSSSISMCTALEHRQVMRSPYRFASFRPFFTVMGPKQSIPTFVKGGDGSVLSFGRSPMSCSAGLPLSFLQMVHLRRRVEVCLEAPKIQNPKDLTSFKVIVVP